MDANSRYDNTFSNTVTALVGTIVRTFERSIVVFWDGLKNATVHGTPSLLGFVAAVSPIVAPLYTAIQTAHSLTAFLQQPVYQAVIGAIALEFIGFELWVFLTEILMTSKWDNSKIQIALAGGVVVYETILVGVNVILMYLANSTISNGELLMQTLIMFAWCLLPALAAIGYGWQNAHNKAMLERERIEQAEQAERIRQERRQDKKEREQSRADAKFRERK